MRWARRGSAPCRKARPGVLFMELKGWWGRCRKAQTKEPTSFHNEAGTITITEKYTISQYKKA